MSTDAVAVSDEMDRRIAARLAAALPVVVDATNVTPHARARMISWAGRYGRPVAVLHTDRAQLVDEGISVVIDVPGEAEGLSPAQAAELIRLAA